MIRSMTDIRARIGPLDIAIAIVAAGLAFYYMALQVNDETLPDATWWAVPTFALLAVPLLWRRTAPLAATAATLAILAGHIALFGDAVIRCGIEIPLSLVLLFAVSARLDRRDSLIGLGLVLVMGLLVCLTDHATGADISAMPLILVLALVVGGVGVVVRSRGRMVKELEARTAELRTTRDERARLEVAGDRARLSAELDGLLQQRLTALTALADRGADVSDPEAASEALARIERESRATLEEMRQVVGVLRDDSAADMAPQPTLTQLEGLLVRAKGAGARLTVEGRPRALPAGVELSAYRVVEHLLEALQDTPGVEVAVHFADDSLELRVSGPLRRRGADAIERARERVRLHHGELRATTVSGRAEAVVSFPLLAPV